MQQDTNRVVNLELTVMQMVLICGSVQMHLETSALLDASHGAEVDPVEYGKWRHAMQEIQDKLLTLATSFPAKPSAEGE